jgi:hypothetical protein
MATPSLIIKQYDTYPPLLATLTDSNGAIDLTSALIVEFVMRGRNTGTPVTGNCTVVNATTGQVSYQWASSDTIVADTYDVEFYITWATGGKQTVPNAAAANPVVEVDADLAGASG